MNKTTRSNRFGRIALTATAGAIIALPLFAATTETASAQLGQNRNGRWNNRNNAQRGTMLATVISNPSGNRMTVRADDNRTFEVRGNVTNNVRVGSRVELTGFINNNNIFVADSVRVISNSGGRWRDRGNYGGNYGYNSSQRGSMDATVTSVASGNRFTVRADDNRTFTVQTNANIRNLRVGDRVSVYGYITNGTLFVADNVRVVSNNYNGNWGSGGGIYGNGYSGNVDFYATVLNMNGNYVQVRGDNGRTYNVLPNNESTFHRGERIRIIGVANRRGIQATSISRQ